MGSATTPSSRATRTAPLRADAKRMILPGRAEFIGRHDAFAYVIGRGLPCGVAKTGPRASVSALWRGIISA